MREARSTSRRRDEKAANQPDLEPAAKTLGSKVGRLLGKDQQGREHCFWPARGEITVREHTDDGTMTVHEFDLDGRPLPLYRDFVDEEVDDCEVDWNDRVFEEVLGR